MSFVRISRKYLDFFDIFVQTEKGNDLKQICKYSYK